MQNEETAKEFITITLTRSGIDGNSLSRLLECTDEEVDMLKGSHFLMLDKLQALAAKHKIHPLYLFKLLIQKYSPATFDSLNTTLKGFDLTEEELLVVSAYRKLSADHRESKKLVGVVFM